MQKMGNSLKLHGDLGEGHARGRGSRPAVGLDQAWLVVGTGRLGRQYVGLASRPLTKLGVGPTKWIGIEPKLGLENVWALAQSKQ